MKTSTTLSKISFFASGIVLIFVFYLIVSLVKDNQLIYPSWNSIFISLGELLTSKEIYLSLGMTLLRVIIVLGISLAISLLISFIYLLKKDVFLIFKPLLLLLKATPLAIVSVYLWISLGADKAPYLITLLMVLPVMIEGFIAALDEIDNSDPSALIVINSALANGYMAFPHETIDRHKDFRIVTAANTWGKGADLQYVGRNALDAATLDRFDNIFFDYDRKLEECLYPNLEILKFMWSFRDAVLATRIPHIVSTRGIGKVYKKEINGIPVKDILISNVIKNLSQDDVNTIIGNMRDISSSNKYFKEIKSLTLKR